MRQAKVANEQLLPGDTAVDLQNQHARCLSSGRRPRQVHANAARAWQWHAMFSTAPPQQRRPHWSSPSRGTGGEFLTMVVRVVLGWCGVSLLVAGVWILTIATVRRDRAGVTAAFGFMLPGCVFLWRAFATG